MGWQGVDVYGWCTVGGGGVVILVWLEASGWKGAFGHLTRWKEALSATAGGIP